MDRDRIDEGQLHTEHIIQEEEWEERRIYVLTYLERETEKKKRDRDIKNPTFNEIDAERKKSETENKCSR